MPLSPGETLQNRYRIVKLLGQGGFGAVYRAWDLNLQRPCAIKENLETGLESKEQFEREARMLSNLTHPHLPRVTDYFMISGLGQYLVMDFIEGEDLQEELEQAGGPLPISQVLPWIEQVSDALGYLHAQTPPIIHRDIKPKNIIVASDGKAFVVDFGIAKLFDPNQLTTIGARAVTPGYSPIEQYGHGKTDARTDIYALGATFYTMLTGEVPVESVQRSETSLLLPRAINPDISPEVERAILKAMELAPTNRFRNTDEFISALQPRQRVQVTPTAVVSPAVAQTMVAGRGSAEPSSADPTALPPGSGPPGSIPPGAGHPAPTWDEPARKRSPWRLLAFIIVLIIIGLAAAVFAYPALTGEPLPLFAGLLASQTPTPSPSPTPTQTAMPSQTSTNTSIPTSTPKPTTTTRPATPTSRPTNTHLIQTITTKSLEPILSLDQDYHCRGGPGTNYEIVRDLKEGETFELYGWNGHTWYLIKLDDPSTRKQICWVGGGYLIQGEEGQLPICQWTGDGYTADPSCQ